MVMLSLKSVIFYFLKTYDMKCPRDLYLSGVSIWKR